MGTTCAPSTPEPCRCPAAGRSSGWPSIPTPPPNTDDLLALADAVREVGLSYDQPANDSGVAPRRNGIVELGRRGHLTVLADPDA